MTKTHPKSRIVQFHHHSEYGMKLLDEKGLANEIVLQIEPVAHKNYDFIAEVVSVSDYSPPRGVSE